MIMHMKRCKAAYTTLLSKTSTIFAKNEELLPRIRAMGSSHKAPDSPSLARHGRSGHGLGLGLG